MLPSGALTWPYGLVPPERSWADSRHEPCHVAGVEQRQPDKPLVRRGAGGRDRTDDLPLTSSRVGRFGWSLAVSVAGQYRYSRPRRRPERTRTETQTETEVSPGLGEPVPCVPWRAGTRRWGRGLARRSDREVAVGPRCRRRAAHAVQGVEGEVRRLRVLLGAGRVRAPGPVPRRWTGSLWGCRSSLRRAWRHGVLRQWVAVGGINQRGRPRW